MSKEGPPQPFKMKDFSLSQCQHSTHPVLLLVNNFCHVESEVSYEECLRLFRAVCSRWVSIELHREGLETEHHARRRGTLIKYSSYTYFQWGFRLTEAAKSLRLSVSPGEYPAKIEILGNKFDFRKEPA